MENKTKSKGLVEFEMKVGGMTCVACSSSIERLMHTEFDKKGMISVTIVLLTHKMMLKFEAERYTSKEVTPDMIVDEVEMIGFDCELSGIKEISSKEFQATICLPGFDNLSEIDADTPGRLINDTETGELTFGSKRVRNRCLRPEAE